MSFPSFLAFYLLYLVTSSAWLLIVNEFVLLRIPLLVGTAGWVLCLVLVKIFNICQAIAAMQSKTKKLSVMKDLDKEEVEKVMKKVDNRNLRRISRMLIEADVKAVEEQERLKDLSMQKVFKSVETRNIRKVSKSLQVWSFSYFKKKYIKHHHVRVEHWSPKFYV